MSGQLTILVGTMTGTADLVAQDLKARLAAEGLPVQVLDMEDLDGSSFASDGPFLICISTYGGDLPDNAQGFYGRLEAEGNDLSGVEFGVFALGDSAYDETYCLAARRFDDLLRSLGARRIGEVKEHDASDGTRPEAVALEWIAGWLETAGAARGDAGLATAS